MSRSLHSPTRRKPYIYFSTVTAKKSPRPLDRPADVDLATIYEFVIQLRTRTLTNTAEAVSANAIENSAPQFRYDITYEFDQLCGGHP